MFGDLTPFEWQIEKLLDTLSLEDIFEELDITPHEVLVILFKGGHVELPPWLEEEDDAVCSED